MQVKKVCLTAVNSKYIHSSLSVISLAKMCRVYSEKYSVEIPEITVHEVTINNNFDSLIYSIMSTHADVYAFSVYIWNVSLVCKICKHIRLANPESIIILGGPEVSFGVEHTPFEDGDYDYIICSEGERSFYGLMCELNNIEIPSEWNYKVCGKIREADYIENLDEIEFPYNKKNISNYSDRIMYYEASRGCPFRCAYCLSAVCGKVRELSLARVFKDLDFFIEHDVRQVKFVDRTFNCNKKRAKEIWQYIIKNGYDKSTNFHFEIGADLLDDESVDILSKARPGLIQLEMGIQSTNESALCECCRKTDMNKLFANVNKITKSGNVNAHVDLIAGLPYEGYSEFSKSFDDAYSLHAHQLQLGMLKLLSGAPLNNLIEKHGYVFSSSSPYEIISNKYISFNELMRLKQIEDVLERYYNSGKFVRTLKKADMIFSSPFKFYEKLADFYVKRGMIFTSVSAREVYNQMSMFLKLNGIDADRELLLDFYTGDKSDVLPSELKYLCVLRDKMGTVLKNSSQNMNKKAQLRFIENEAYIIDYSEKNPVTGTYKIAEVIKNVCL